MDKIWPELWRLLQIEDVHVVGLLLTFVLLSAWMLASNRVVTGVRWKDCLARVKALGEELGQAESKIWDLEERCLRDEVRLARLEEHERLETRRRQHRETD